MVQAYRDTWELGLHSYLTYLRDRLLLCRELLHPTGSIFVQMNDENLHRVRELLDEVFESENFLSLISYTTSGGFTSATLSRAGDYVIWYAKDKSRMKYRELFQIKASPVGDTQSKYDQLELPDGTRRPMTAEEKGSIEPLLKDARIFRVDNLVSQGYRQKTTVEYEFEGRIYHPGPTSNWKASVPEGMDRLAANRRIVVTGRGKLGYVRYWDDFPAAGLTNMWSDIGGAVQSRSDPKIYVVQTGQSVVARCVLMTTDPGDLVLDPTCGSGTTAYVAEQLGRRWITIDTSRVPLALAPQRLLTATFPYYELRDPAQGPAGGFVYKRKQNQKGEEVGEIVPHITLRSIAQNEPPQEEVLVDRPEVEPGVVRVSGPFVAEATIPTAIEVEPVSREVERDYESDPIGRMIEVLRRSPALRIAGNQTVTLRNIRRPAKALDLHAEADIVEPTVEDLADEAARQKSLDMKRGKPVAFIFGPEHGPVTEQMVFAAAKEAHLKSYAHLFVVGFAVQPGASKLIQSCQQAVGLPATYVQASMDLLMGDLLKTTRASQIFAVTGAPDVSLVRLKQKGANGPLYRVELLGLDVFDPVTMQTEHRKGDDVPAWLLDTDYDDLVFHVGQAFFPRTGAWENLKRALKGNYEDSVWEHLAGTVSEPFAAGEHGKIAVKVIDDRGNELMVVRSLDEAKPER